MRATARILDKYTALQDSNNRDPLLRRNSLNYLLKPAKRLSISESRKVDWEIPPPFRIDIV
jgi:hypothetical protein